MEISEFPNFSFEHPSGSAFRKYRSRTLALVQFTNPNSNHRVYLFQQSCGIVFDYHCITFCLLRLFYNYRDAAWTKEFSSSAHQNQPFQIQPLKPQPIANLPMSTAASNWATDFLNQAPELKSSPAAGKLSGKL